jgi:acyl-CoA synthetase (NDP forming)
VSVGNKADVSGNDLIEFWAQDDGTDVILLYLESFGIRPSSSQLARRVSRDEADRGREERPHGERRARAATSHTGALAGSDAAVDALFHQSGVIRTDTIEELFDTALLLAYQPFPTGRRVAILTNAGGPGIMAADACESAGLELPALSSKTTKALRAFLPAEASVRNPVDMIASAGAESYQKALSLLVADENVDAVIVIFVPPLVTGAPAVARAILAGGKGSRKPILSCFMGSHGVPESLKSPERGTHSLVRVSRGCGANARARGGVRKVARIGAGYRPQAPEREHHRGAGNHRRGAPGLASTGFARAPPPGIRHHDPGAADRRQSRRGRGGGESRSASPS